MTGAAPTASDSCRRAAGRGGVGEVVMAASRQGRLFAGYPSGIIAEWPGWIKILGRARGLVEQPAQVFLSVKCRIDKRQPGRYSNTQRLRYRCQACRNPTTLCLVVVL